MSDLEISVAQGKKEFTKIIRDLSQSEYNIIITKRGSPAAVIMSFEAYRKLKKRAVYAELIGLRKRLSKSGVSAQAVYQESKRMLEEGR
jgi:prevent-host-death family protein